MLLSAPVQSVVPSAHGAVLGVLARTDEALSGRGVAALTKPPFSQKRVSVVLGELVEAGVVLVEHRPPSNLYRLNREHVAAAGVIALTRMWSEVMDRMAAEVKSWAVQPEAVWLFGSAARGEGGTESDIDVLFVVPEVVRSVGPAQALWAQQVDGFVDKVYRWTGNRCELLEVTHDELVEAVARGDRLVEELKADAVPIRGPRFNPRRFARPVAG